ncbi:MAG: hypothetical protein U0998_11745 [Moraxellaceae bacterium]|nr:hypothetical protein [Moraxellaceae bacterium]MDZ4297282.1 hypothetical protein [Moraxellaceae bacterium]MDZ4387843.1 hypothetical protein [Moraxellaceae bacterium]
MALSFTWHQSRPKPNAAPDSTTDLVMLEEANDALALEIDTLEAEIHAIEDMNADTKRLLELKSARLQALESQP